MNDARIYYTASVVLLDGSDTNSSGEPCEPGQGYIERHGYIDPSWSVFDTEEIDREAAVCDTVPEDTDDPVQWLAERIRDRVGTVNLDPSAHHFYSVAAITDGPQLSSATLCAHLHGVTDDVLAHVWAAVARLQGE